jgi:hypothetical protein
MNPPLDSDVNQFHSLLPCCFRLSGFSSTLKMEMVNSSELPVNFCYIVRLHITVTVIKRRFRRQEEGAVDKKTLHHTILGPEIFGIVWDGFLCAWPLQDCDEP